MASCPICLEEIKDEKITKCNHKFCKECLETWLNVNISCPICREKLKEKIIRGNEVIRGFDEVFENRVAAVPELLWTINTNDYYAVLDNTPWTE